MLFVIEFLHTENSSLRRVFLVVFRSLKFRKKCHPVNGILKPVSDKLHGIFNWFHNCFDNAAKHLSAFPSPNCTWNIALCYLVRAWCNYHANKVVHKVHFPLTTSLPSVKQSKRLWNRVGVYFFSWPSSSLRWNINLQRCTDPFKCFVYLWRARGKCGQQSTWTTPEVDQIQGHDRMGCCAGERGTWQCTTAEWDLSTVCW